MIHHERVIASSDRLPPIVSTALDELPTLGLVLDVGAGKGRMQKSLAYRTDVTVVGLEYDRELAILASQMEGNQRMVVGDARQLPFRTKAFDTLVSVNTLHEIVSADSQIKRDRILQEVFRNFAAVLKQGGHMVIYDGFMPLNETDPLLVLPKNESSAMQLEQFNTEYLGGPISISRSESSPDWFETDMGTIVNLLTKINYLQDGTAWEGERKQCYPFASLSTITRALNHAGLEIIRSQHPEGKRVGLEGLLNGFDVIDAATGERYTNENFPQCQIQLTALKKV